MKQHFDRIRATQLASDLLWNKGLLRVPDHGAYPSGHGATGAFLAYMCCALDPANCGERTGTRDSGYMARGYRIGFNRELATMHYPSDTEYSWFLAERVTERIIQQSPPPTC